MGAVALSHNQTTEFDGASRHELLAIIGGLRAQVAALQEQNVALVGQLTEVQAQNAALASRVVGLETERPAAAQ